jgi:predicted HTH domain antitoxin
MTNRKVMMAAPMVQLETFIPEDVYLTLRDHGLARKELAEQARQLLAMRYFQEKVLSLGKAAHLADMDRWDFIDLLGSHQIPVVDLDEEEFALEMATVDTMIQTLHSGDGE